MRAKYPKNKLVRAVSDAKIENERFSVACSRCRQNLKFSDMTSSSRREPHGSTIIYALLTNEIIVFWLFRRRRRRRS